MAKVAIAFSPGHISGYFKKISGHDERTTGSIGAGIVIHEGVRAKVTPSSHPSVIVKQFSYHRNMPFVSTGSPPVEYAMQRLGVTAQVTTETHLPIGAGFGCSAAALLSSITALSELFSLELRRHEVAALAHEAEVVHRTGLGDVAASQGGGLACRKGPGIEAEIVRLCDIEEPLFALSFGPISTPAVLDSPEKMARIEGAFPGRCPTDLNDFLSLSRTFAEKSGLISDMVRKVLVACDDSNVPASMTMLGHGVFACGNEAYDVLSRFGQPITLHVAQAGYTGAEVHEDS